LDLYLIRHADAAALGEGGIIDDASRPLTARGEEQARKVATGLQRHGIQLGAVVSSPLLRARQTAEGIVGELPEPQPQVRITEDLAPGGKRRKLGRFLKELGSQSVALVGHQPDLGMLAAWLIGSKKAEIDFAKAGVACIRCEVGAGRVKGSLVWLVTPEWLG
jgi:phosphohistidine phosphatase